MTAHPNPYAGTTPVAALAHVDGTVTLVEGTTFVVSERSGDVQEGLAQGLFVLDTRVLSRWRLLVDGYPIETLTVQLEEPYAATFVARAKPAAGHADATLVVFRTRHVGAGMREVISLTNYGLDPVRVTVEIDCDADFADLFAVKDGRVVRTGSHTRQVDPGSVRFEWTDGTRTKRATLRWSTPADEHCTWRPELAPGATWSLCAELVVGIDDVEVEPRFRCGSDDTTSLPSRRLTDWRVRVPTFTTDHEVLARTLERSMSDLGALRIFDPEHPDDPIVAAGAPWFMTIFGRDSLLAAWMSMIADHRLAGGVLRTLARFQGGRFDEESEEQPGKVLHEMRFAKATGRGLAGGEAYYGSVDATPLFVVLLGELWRWNPHDPVIEEMLPHADRALEWIVRHGDRDGDGYVEYQGRPGGLANQGWKDSWDAVRFADGGLATPPIALCEVQAYTYAAFVVRAQLAEARGEPEVAAEWWRRAADLRRRFNEDFWMEDEGTFALGLDGDKRQIDAVTSNPGHCLWAGIVDPALARRVGDRLLAPDSFSGFGVRTLSSRMRAFNPVSYHNGSVWPHDNAICAAGLARYGLVDHAHRVIAAQLDVAEAVNGSLPELFAGFDRTQVRVPAPYPASCSPQAWAAAAPLLWVRVLLGLEPDLPRHRVRIAPRLLPGMCELRAEGIRVGTQELTITVTGDRVRVDGARGLEVVAA